MKRIKLTQGKSTIVSDRDYRRLSKFKWCAKQSSSDWYAVRGVWLKKARRVQIVRMHRIIMHCPANKQVHHKNGKSLDNRRRNLEMVSPTKNLAFRS